jgi:hypothetical protein
MQQQKTQYPQSRDGGLWIDSKGGGQVCSIRNTQAASADYKRKPDYSGNIKLTPEMMKLLIQMAKDGKEMTIQLSAWEKIPKSGGTPYISISSEVYYRPEGQQQQQPQQQYQQPQPQYQPAPPPPPPVQQPAPQAAPTPSSDFIDDDIPF